MSQIFCVLFLRSLCVYKSKKKNKNRKQNFRVQTERENKLNKQEKNEKESKKLHYTTKAKPDTKPN